MGRLTGPKHRMCRRVGERLCNTDKCPSARRQSPPGVHGVKGYPRLTEYGTQLREKQKTKYLYGVMERQFRRYFDDALRRQGNTAENFLKSLELRLDNVVFRLGLAKTRAAARQLVNHGWVTVDGKRVTIPSFQTSVGDIIGLKSGTKNGFIGQNLTKSQPASLPSWLASSGEEFGGKVVSAPVKDDFPQNVNMALVVEFYSR